VPCRLLALLTEARRGRPRRAHCRHARTPAGAAAGRRRPAALLPARPPALARATVCRADRHVPPDRCGGRHTRGGVADQHPHHSRGTAAADARWVPCHTVRTTMGATPIEVRPIGQTWAPEGAGDRLKGSCSCVCAAQGLETIRWSSPPDGTSVQRGWRRSDGALLQMKSLSKGAPGAPRTPSLWGQPRVEVEGNNTEPNQQS